MPLIFCHKPNTVQHHSSSWFLSHYEFLTYSLIQSPPQVNFLLTNALGVRRRRNTDLKQWWSDEQELFEHERKRRSLSNPLNRVYEELAEASGGLAIEATKKTLPMATSIITDAASSAMVGRYMSDIGKKKK